MFVEEPVYTGSVKDYAGCVVSCSRVTGNSCASDNPVHCWHLLRGCLYNDGHVPRCDRYGYSVGWVDAANIDIWRNSYRHRALTVERDICFSLDSFVLGY